jgi:hypothetical protein
VVGVSHTFSVAAVAPGVMTELIAKLSLPSEAGRTSTVPSPVRPVTVNR